MSRADVLREQIAAREAYLKRFPWNFRVKAEVCWMIIDLDAVKKYEALSEEEKARLGRMVGYVPKVQS